MLTEMNDKNVDVEVVAGKALKDESLLSELLDGLKLKNETVRYNCFKVLMRISEEHASVLYPKWDYFVELMGTDNAYHRLSGLQIIANLASVDIDNRFDEIFDSYFGLLGSKGTIVAAYVAVNSGKIAKAKPHLQARITDILLNIDKIHTGKQIEMIKSGVIEALDKYFEEAENRDAIVEFVRNQLNSESPKTRRQAKEFLNKWV
jgi:hypothetical protein